MGLFDWLRGKKSSVSIQERRAGHAIEPAHLAALEETRRPFVRITFDRQAIALSPVVSKVGGEPYTPAGALPPPSQFIFIAQLNFAEVPRIDGMPLPDTGIVQFWVEDDDTFGMFDARGNERTDGHRIVHHADVDAPQARGVAGHHGRGPLVGLDDPHGRRMRFSVGSELVPNGDVAWEAFKERVPLVDARELHDHDDDTGHKIGGYCAFTQWDPRDPADPMLSLLQLDDDEVCGWGDAGIAHWFIREADLRERNFANVRYYWDCC